MNNKFNNYRKEDDKVATDRLLDFANKLYEQMENGYEPSLTLPSRSRNNIIHNEDTDVWTYGDRKTKTSAKSKKGALKLLQRSELANFLQNNHLKQNKGSTLRELYYISEGWDIAKFKDQHESDRAIEDFEIICGLQREYFHVRPEEDGATMLGPIRLRETTRRGDHIVHCQEDIGQSGYTIPFNVENLELLESDAKFILAVETGGMYARLIENGFDQKYDAVLVHLKGQPSRSTRVLMKKMNERFDLPIAVFTDADPWSYRIFSTIAYGAIKTAHLSEDLAIPGSKFVGVQPSDIVDYDLSTDKLKEKDIEALRSELIDPRFQSNYWEKQIRLQLEINKKAEQQAFAGKGLDYVTDVYLPDRLTELGVI
ncbi:DNA topoisomerase IV subunit A [Methanolobus bombayensis]|uniref:DNA topoisomerase IV subunit A n=1 Tax=Methanolobus bombayensis TaxID=38023 RepID=UPI001AEAB841|nr:DNA topoisomerase IV subunit A [Methanolobus bombayensis]MBP1910118.1 DNA topoisomerase-6 subunit A [Methanolobus bombayensis]